MDRPAAGHDCRWHAARAALPLRPSARREAQSFRVGVPPPRRPFSSSQPRGRHGLGRGVARKRPQEINAIGHPARIACLATCESERKQPAHPAGRHADRDARPFAGQYQRLGKLRHQRRGLGCHLPQSRRRSLRRCRRHRPHGRDRRQGPLHHRRPARGFLHPGSHQARLLRRKHRRHHPRRPARRDALRTAPQACGRLQRGNHTRRGNRRRGIPRGFAGRSISRSASHAQHRRRHQQGGVQPSGGQ